MQADIASAGTRNRRLTIVLFTSAVLLFWMAQYIYLPTLPTYIQIKTGNLAAVGFVLSMFGLWQAIVRLPLGIAADWLGWHKPFILLGLALAGMGAWIMGTSGGVEGLVLGRAITGLSAGTWVAMVVAFSALFPPRDAVRASALLTFFNSLGRILATAVTGSLNDLGGYSLAFFAATGIAALSIVILLPVGEARRPPKSPSVGSLHGLILRRDVMLPSLLSTVGQYANWATSFGFMPVLAKQFGATGMQQSAIVTLHIAIVALGNFLATSIANRVGMQRMLYLSWAVMFAGIATAAFTSTLPVLFMAQACIGLGIGVSYPVLMGMSIQYVSDAERATAMGLHQAVYAIGMFGGPAVSGIIADAIGIQPMFGATAFACIALGLIGTRGLRKSEI